MNESILDRAIEILEQVSVEVELDQPDPEKNTCRMGKLMQCPCDDPICASCDCPK